MKPLSISPYVLCSTLFLGSCNHQYSANLIANNSASSPENISLQLGAARDLSTDFFCYNVNATQVADWSDPEFIKAVNSLNPSLLRIPGGDVGNYWNWQRGGLIENTQSLPAGLPFFLRFKARRYTGSKLADLQAGLTNTETEPIFVLNMLTSDLSSQLAMLKTAQKMGMPIKYVELGNEFYFNIPNYKKVFPSPRAYGLAAQDWTETIKQEFPEAEVSIVGVVPDPGKPPRLQNWNKVMRGTALKQADAITLHFYPNHGLSAASQSTASYPYFNDTEVPIILGEPFRNWHQLIEDSNFQAIPDNKQIWLTEYNLFEDIFQSGNERPIPRVAGSWAHGLYNITTSLLFLEEPRIKSVCHHSLSEGSIFGAILNDSDSFVNPNDETMSVTPMSLSASGEALSLLGQATKGMTQAYPIEFSNSMNIYGKANYNYPSLYGWQFSNGSEGKSILINLGQQTHTLNLSNLLTSAQYQQISGAPQDLVHSDQGLTKSSGSVNNTIELPPYSVTQLSTSSFSD